MSATTSVLTVASKNNMHMVRVLMESMRQHHPDWHRCLILADRVDGHFDVAQEPFEIVEAESLHIADFAQMAFAYTPLELWIASSRSL